MTAPPSASGAVEAGLDPFDRRRVRTAAGLLRTFNGAGVLDAADVHVAARLGALGGEHDEAVLLGAALAVRALRLGHVCADLQAAPATVTTDLDVPVDLSALPWPEPDGWLGRLAASPVVAVGDHEPPAGPLRLVGRRLYLDRYWRQEREVAADLRERSRGRGPAVAEEVLAAGLDRLFPGAGPDLQRLAAAVAVLRRLAVVGGGPGTGKTTTVARILALLHDQASAAGAPPPRVALAAPTGKAAARLEEAVHAEAASMDLDGPTRERLLRLEGSTLHRLLGWRPDSRSRFRHHRGNRLPHDVVVVDETSMVSLSLMAKLVEAVRPGARLVLVGDPEQLASVEAGAVLGDVVGPAAAGLVLTPAWRDQLARVTGRPVPEPAPGGGAPAGPGGIPDGIVVLRRVHRYGGGIAELASAVQRGDAGTAVAVLGRGGPDVAWVDADLAGPGAARAMAPVRRAVVDAGAAVVEAAAAGDGPAALAALGALRLLCAHRRGPYGAATWMAAVEGWLAAAVPGYGTEGRWYVGRPLLVTENDYGLRLYNGDTGVVVAAADGRVAAVFERGGRLLEVAPTRLGPVESVHAMTVHKSQGSQFDAVVLLLPDPASPLLTRELLYTGLTRARSRLTLVGTEASVRAAVGRPVARASGLRERLWAPAT